MTKRKKRIEMNDDSAVLMPPEGWSNQENVMDDSDVETVALVDQVTLTDEDLAEMFKFLNKEKKEEKPAE